MAEHPDRVVGARFQFRIRHLFAWTTVIAVLAAMFAQAGAILLILAVNCAVSSYATLRLLRPSARPIDRLDLLAWSFITLVSYFTFFAAWLH